MGLQRQTLTGALSVLQKNPRLTSLHSYKATSELLSLIAEFPQPGLILHWWLGTESETNRAVELGCYFSVNGSSVVGEKFSRRYQLIVCYRKRIIRLETGVGGFSDQVKLDTLRRHLQKPTVSVGRRFAGKLGELLRLSFGRAKPVVYSLVDQASVGGGVGGVGTDSYAFGATLEIP